MDLAKGALGVSRRAFLGGMAGFAAGAAMGAGEASGAEGFTFILCSDLHAQDVPQGERVLRDILAAARRHGADFIIQLGDFIRPGATALRAIWEDKNPATGFAGGRYLAIGNHDLDTASWETFCGAFMDTSDPRTPKVRPYYSFDHKGLHFVFLNGNETNVSFRLDAAQLAWLRADLEAATARCLLFCHESLDHEQANGREAQALLEEVNRAAGWRKVVAVFSGHNHSSYDRSLAGIRHIQINSASYVWIGLGHPGRAPSPAQGPRQVSPDAQVHPLRPHALCRGARGRAGAPPLRRQGQVPGADPAQSGSERLHPAHQQLPAGLLGRRRGDSLPRHPVRARLNQGNPPMRHLPPTLALASLAAADVRRLGG